MIKIIKGDMLKVQRGILVHGCNCYGVMGAGIAQQVRSRWPDVYDFYARHCETLGKGALGTITIHNPAKDLVLVNAMTQDGFGKGMRHVNYEAVAQCFERINDVLGHKASQLPVCFPMIGAGLGGGNWPIVKAIIDETLLPQFERRLYVLP
jgi:O-acetyl-ADP-ribose deacetylase (regulator of RNase III)